MYIDSSKNFKLKVNYNYLGKYRGHLKSRATIEKYIGYILRIVSILFILGLILYRIIVENRSPLSSNLPSDSLIWVGGLLFIFSFYLTRDRDKFLDNLFSKNLHSLTKKSLQKEIEVVDYISLSTHILYDQLINKRNINIIEELTKFKEVEDLIFRFGLNLSEFKSIKFKTEQKESLLINLLKDSFVLGATRSFRYLDIRTVFITFCLNYIQRDLLAKGVLLEEIAGTIEWIQNTAKSDKYKQRIQKLASFKSLGNVNRSLTSTYAGTLNQYGNDLLKDVVKSQNFKYYTTHTKEISTIFSLLEQKKTNILLLGQTNTSHKTILQNISLRMIAEDVPKVIKDHRLLEVDINFLSATIKSFEELKEALAKIFKEASESKNIVLVITNLHNIFELNSNYAGEIVNIIARGLADSKLKIIATANQLFYSRIPYNSIKNLLNVVEVKPPDEKTSIQLMIDIAKDFERDFKVKISFDAIKTLVKLANQFNFDKDFPEKGKDLLLEIIHECTKNNTKMITEKEVSEILTKKTGLKMGIITGNESELLKNLEHEMHKRIVGQNEAINSVSNALRRNRAGLGNQNKPIASFLFFGPTGVGKTEVAKTISHVWYGSEQKMIRIDMSEFHEDKNIDKLIGTVNSKGTLTGGFLSEAVRKNPFGVLLLDEIEKAHPKVFDLLLTVLDEAYIIDGLGRRISFQNIIIIATSNAGSNKIDEIISNNIDYNNAYSILLPELKSIFRVEFLNRFDSLIMFNPLTQKAIEKIAEKFIRIEAHKLLGNKGIVLKWTPQFLREIAVKGYNKAFGAREMQRVIQEEVVNKIAMFIIEKKISYSDTLILNDLKNFQISQNEKTNP